MGGGVRPSGCERCGRTEGVTYAGWQYLCRPCRAALQVELKWKQGQERQAAAALAAAKQAPARPAG